MKIYSPIDYQENTIDIGILPEPNINNLPKKSRFLAAFSKIERSKYAKALELEELVEAWNKDGFEVLAKFLLLVADVNETIDVVSADVETLTFTIRERNGSLITITLLMGDKHDKPAIILEKGDITKIYACENKAGQIFINLQQLIVQNGSSIIHRDFSSKDFKLILEGFGYTTDITISNQSPDEKKIVLKEEEILKDMMEQRYFGDVISLFYLLFYSSSETLSKRRTEINVGSAMYGGDYINLERFQKLIVSSNMLVHYERKGPTKENQDLRFIVDFDGEEYFEKFKHQRKPDEALAAAIDGDFVKEEQKRYNELIDFLKFYIDNDGKFLRLANKDNQ
jgi:hypothetical protein